MLREDYECLGIAANITTVIELTQSFLLFMVLLTLIEKR